MVQAEDRPPPTLEESPEREATGVQLPDAREPEEDEPEAIFAPSDSDVEEATRSFVVKYFSPPTIVSDDFTINGWEDFGIDGEVHAKVLRRDDNGDIWVDVRVKCSGEVTRDEDADGLDEPPILPRHYFLSGKVLVYTYGGELNPEWNEHFPNEVRYDDLQGEGSYRIPDDDNE